MTETDRWIESWREAEGDDAPSYQALCGSFEKPEWAAGMCVEAAESFAAHLNAIGVPAKTLDVFYKETGLPHTVVSANGTVIDWTYRQFDEHASIPEVWTPAEFHGLFTDKAGLGEKKIYNEAVLSTN